MHRLTVVLIALFVATSLALSQNNPRSVVRDRQAVSLLQHSIASMATVAPSDSSEAGNVQITAGGTTSYGTVQILTRGAGQTSIQVQTPNDDWTVVYSQGQASRTDAETSTALSLEATSTSQCSFFPLPYLSGIVRNPDSSLQFIGTESLNGSPVQHLRTWNTFHSNPPWQFLSPYTLTDIWLDIASGLPRRISFVQRDGGGATPKIATTIDFLSFQNANGISYPTVIQESVEGSPWMTITIQSANFNAGLTDANFPVVQEGN